MKILIFGASGLVGRWSSIAALDSGHDVVAVSREQSVNLDFSHVKFLQENLEVSKWASLLAKHEPEVIVHCDWEGVSSASKNSEVQKSNINRWLHLAELEATLGVRKSIFLGSQAEYGLRLGMIQEGDIDCPVTAYGSAKVHSRNELAQLFKDTNTEFVWARLFSFYGSMDLGNWLVPSTIQTLLSGKTMKLSSGLQKWNYLHIADIANALILLAEGDLIHSEFNVANPNSISIKEIALTIATQLNKRELISFDLTDEQEFIPDVLPSSQRIQNMNWEPEISLVDGISKSIEWYLGKHQHVRDYGFTKLDQYLPDFKGFSLYNS